MKITPRNYDWRSAIIVVVPIVALLVAARQVYLSRYHDLTTWKGGGMGMFAGADFSLNRYAKLFITDSNGQRQPLTELTREQTDLVKRALRSGRRFIDYYGLKTARDHHDLLHERIWNFVADRCRRQRKKDGLSRSYLSK